MPPAPHAHHWLRCFAFDSLSITRFLRDTNVTCFIYYTPYVSLFTHPFRWLSTQPVCFRSKMSYNDLLQAYQFAQRQFDDVCLRLESSEAVAKTVSKQLNFAQDTISGMKSHNEMLLTYIAYLERCKEVSSAEKVSSYAPVNAFNACNTDQGALDKIAQLEKERNTVHKSLAKLEADNDVLMHDRKHPVDMRVYEDLYKKQKNLHRFERRGFLAAALFLFAYNVTWAFFYQWQRRQ